MGGSATAGGAGGASACKISIGPQQSLVPAQPGAAGSGGAGAILTCESVFNPPAGVVFNGSGGGGGWFGGGGSGPTEQDTATTVIGAGGGGSGRLDSTATATLNEVGVQQGNGTVFVSYSLP
jgi:hypothetical protein